MFWKEKPLTKCESPEYNTLWGGYTGGYCPGTGERSYTNTEYTLLYGKFRNCYSSTDLKDGWIHRSWHWNNVNNGGIAWNFHIAYRCKWPFLKIGFANIKNLYKER